MTTYLEQVRVQSNTQVANKSAERNQVSAKAAAEWTERLTPLEDRLAKLLATIPPEIKSQGLSLPAIRNMLAGKWRGKCHPGELGAALRKLGYVRTRAWSKSADGFRSIWHYVGVSYCPSKPRC
jgi:hypothetical protein